MRKLLNTLYITNENAYLSLDGENIVCKLEDNEKFRLPFDNVESVVCFSYLGCSPALMGKCAEKLIPISFISPSGKFLAKVSGETRGNVFLRVAQIDKFRECGLQLAQNGIATKVGNSIHLLNRSRHDNPVLRNDSDMNCVIEQLKDGIDAVYKAASLETVLGIEGNCAKAYFSVFGKLIKSGTFNFVQRSKRPPLDAVNAVLSFIYTLFTNEYASSLETVGLDSYIGFFHSLRSGRHSLACDLVEETRALVERFTITLFNLGIVSANDFEVQISDAVYLNDDGRKKVLTKWQEKKRTDFLHPYLRQKIPLGLIPYIQSNLLAKYVRGEIEEYPTLILKTT